MQFAVPKVAIISRRHAPLIILTDRPGAEPKIKQSVETDQW